MKKNCESLESRIERSKVCKIPGKEDELWAEIVNGKNFKDTNDIRNIL